MALLENKVCIIKFLKRYKKIKLPYERVNYKNKFMISPVDMKVTVTKADNSWVDDYFLLKYIVFLFVWN